MVGSLYTIIYLSDHHNIIIFIFFCSELLNMTGYTMYVSDTLGLYHNVSRSIFTQPLSHITH